MDKNQKKENSITWVYLLNDRLLEFYKEEYLPMLMLQMTRHVLDATLRLLPPLASLHQSSVMGCVDGHIYKTGDELEGIMYERMLHTLSSSTRG